jgi:serine protease
MICSPGQRQLARAFAALAAGACISSIIAPALAWTEADTAQPVRGLIVRLKDAPPNVRIGSLELSPAAGRERPQGVRRVAADAAAHDVEQRRWHGVTASAQLDLDRSAPMLRPVGRDQQMIVFPQALPGAQARALMRRLEALPQVDWVEVNTRERRLQVPGDPYFADGSQWWLLANAGLNANAPADRRRGAAGFQMAWLQPGGTGSAAVPVAVLDTGITSHPDLGGRLLPGYDFVTDLKFANDGDGRDADPSDPGDWVSLADLADPHFAGCEVSNSSWHGTVIAGMLAALTDNGEGSAAINWSGRVLPVRVAGKCGADKADIIDGMRWAAGLEVVGVPRNPNPVRIVNISFGGDAACSADYQAAIDELAAAGVVVVAAAGNEHVSPTRPASCRGVVGVVGLNRDGFKAHSSNFGSALSASGIAAPSGDDGNDASARWNALADPGILSSNNFGTQGPAAPGYAFLWGTSFAAPQVSGTLSLMLSVNPLLSRAQLLDGLKRSARPHVTGPLLAACSWQNPGRCACTTSTCGVGMLDAEQALLFAANPTTYVAPARLAAVIDTPELSAAAALGPDRPANAGDPDPPPPVDPPKSSGGGALLDRLGAAWLLALMLAALALRSASARRR